MLDIYRQLTRSTRRLTLATISTCLLLGSVILVGCSSLSPGNGEESADTGQSLDSAPSFSEQLNTSTAERDEPLNGTQHPTSTGDYISVEHNESSSADDDLVIEPEVGEITFALDITETYEPIDPAFVFSEGITEVHAIFEYRGMSSEDTWERVWYLNEQEVARTSGQWTDPESGVFNYFIDNGGEPLPAGDWILELYVNGKLRSLGVFIIDQN